MAFVSAVTGDDSTKKFMEVLQNDFKTLSAETRKKYPQIREACDEAIDKLALASNNPQASLYGVVNQILYPLVQGCESKDLKIIKFCLGTIQRLIAQQGIDMKGARHIVDCLFNLGQAGVLELKLLQTAALLMTTSELVHGDTLARTMVMCTRMVCTSETRDASTAHAAAATVRQLVALVFERALAEQEGEIKVNPVDLRPQTNSKAPKELKPCAADAYLILQDIIHLINGDAPTWMIGITEVPKSFGLELLDTVLTDFSPVFFKITEFRFLLKEHVCALIIRLFSPNVKYRAAFTSPHIPGAQTANQPNGPASPAPGTDRPHFPVSMRLLRLVSIIIHKYHSILVTECEIFLSLTIKFLDPDKPLWQRALALEVLHKMTIQPHLLTSFCECYDQKPHATNIFQDIVNALGAYVQSLFVASQVNTPPGTQALPQQPGFFWKGVWLPLCVTYEPGTAKSIYLEMLDRSEAPSIQDGYGISVAYACLMETVRSIALTIEGEDYFRLQQLYDVIQDIEDKEVINNKTAIDNKVIENKTELITKNGHSDTDGDKHSENTKNTEEDKSTQLKLQVLKSSWCGLVWGLSVLAEASIGDLENILRAIQTLARVSGKMGHEAGRDACIGALCRCALPGQWCGALGASGAGAGPWRRDAPLDHRHVLWVGTPLPTPQAHAGQQQSFVMVSSRHVAAMRALLVTAQRDGDVIQQAWLPLLTTLQHLVWILGLKPSTGGSMKASRVTADSSAVMSTSAVMADLPALSAMLSRVFESSKNLDDVALHHLIDALCKLSNEAMELAYSNREPSLFAVAKLLETGLANLHRIEVMWRPITNHLLEVCQHPHIRMREWGVEAITYLVQAAFQYHHTHPNLVTEAREMLLLEPLAELSCVRHGDVRVRQLECASRLVHSRGEQLGAAWPTMCHIVAHITHADSEQAIRLAFQCAQVIAGDLLPAAAPRCLSAVLRAVAAFAAQTRELNISLTAVGLMWNISDYLYHNRDKLAAVLAPEQSVLPELPKHSDLPHLDKIWMCLYIRLSELCCEDRAPVRRAATQTLFSCIGAHGSLLSPDAWRALLAVLFPMLHKVQNLSNNASAEKVDTGDHILIHHSRNTAQKQWAETQVLTISGVARVFHSRFQFLSTIGDFERSWTVLLDFITDFSLRKNYEVSIASLKALASVVSAAGRHCKKCDTPSTSRTNGKDKTNDTDAVPDDLHDKIWGAVWRAWGNIATQLPVTETPDICEDGKPAELYIPSVGFLITLLQIFPVIFQHIRSSMTVSDGRHLGKCMVAVVCAPTHISPLDTITPAPVSLADHAHHALDLLLKEALLRRELLPGALESLSAVALCGANPQLSIRCLASACGAYEQAPLPQVLPMLVDALNESFLKCGTQTTSNDGTSKGGAPEIASLFIQILETGLPLARENPDTYKEFWDKLPNVLQNFMFEQSKHAWAEARRLVVVCRQQLLQGRCKAPAPVAAATLALCRRGSMHRAAHAHDNDSELREREEFARTCFETLLQYSMLEDIDSITTSEDEGDPLAVVALLDRFQEVLERYSQDNNTSEQLPRNQLSEVSFVLKALATLTESMKNAPPGKVDGNAWQKLIDVYPSLVGLASRSTLGVSRDACAALRDALMQYKDLLKAPVKM